MIYDTSFPTYFSSDLQIMFFNTITRLCEWSMISVRWVGVVGENIIILQQKMASICHSKQEEHCFTLIYILLLASVKEKWVINTEARAPCKCRVWENVGKFTVMYTHRLDPLAAQILPNNKVWILDHAVIKQAIVTSFTFGLSLHILIGKLAQTYFKLRLSMKFSLATVLSNRSLIKASNFHIAYPKSNSFQTSGTKINKWGILQKVVTSSIMPWSSLVPSDSSKVTNFKCKLIFLTL